MNTSTHTSEKPNFEKVWLMFQETDRKFQETERLLKEGSQETERLLKEGSQETERLLKESSQETDRILTEKFQETDKQFKATDKKIREVEGLFTGKWGRLMEALVEGDLLKLLQRKNIKVDKTFTRIKFTYQNRNGEIDIIAMNGNEIVLVEVKTTLTSEDVKDFIEKTLAIYKKVFPEYKNRKVYGAVAYLNAESHAELNAERMGLYVIKAVGSSSSIINQKRFIPKVF